MTDLPGVHVDDNTVQSAGVITTWLAGIGVFVWTVTLGPLFARTAKNSAAIAKLQAHCDQCPATQAAARKAEIDKAKAEMHVEIKELGDRIEKRMGEQDTSMERQFAAVQANILAALGVKALQPGGD